MGLLWLSTVPPTNALVAIMFGTGHLGILGGMVFLSHQIGSFLGVWLGGYLYDVFGTYDPVWWLGVILGLAAAVIHLPISEQPGLSAMAGADSNVKTGAGRKCRNPNGKDRPVVRWRQRRFFCRQRVRRSR